MPIISRAETYFIAAMMFLILVLCVAAVYIFIRTYKKEMRDNEERTRPDKNAKEKNEIGT